MAVLRVLFVFTARKRGLIDAAARGDAPDTLLFGFNHVGRHGIAPTLHEPEYGALGRLAARQVGRFGPDALQLRTLRRFGGHDAVFLTGAWPLLLAARAIPRLRRPKLVWLNMTLTNLLRRGGWRAALVSAAVRCADAIVCVAEFQRRFLHERLGIAYERLPLVLSGTDARFYDPARAAAPRGASTDPSVLAAGRDPGRDYATLAAAVAAPPALRARIVCSPRNVAGIDLPANVEARFDVPQTALRDEYSAARAVAVPTLGDESTAGSDCSGTLVLLDALAMRRPAAIAARSSVGDYVTPGEHALTYRAGDAVDLRRQLDAAL
ncbi:MAG TPA: glycosyltransferase, partial [Chloroflexota bacterium]|nr:glycosyltransferase [Chloroflexota bacterium]